jgi:hypothetical protein
MDGNVDGNGSTILFPGRRPLSIVLKMVARDGTVQHYTPFGIPANGILLNPKSDLTTPVARC